jgi:hypothetical protein
MQGEWRGDFTRDSFNSFRHFSRVLMQQGRVQIDADWNEQTAILLHYLQTLAAELIGEHGGTGFEIIPVKDANNILTGFTISSGHYYVNGILCENDDRNGNEIALPYTAQSDYPVDASQKLPDFPFLIYLDVWERHISAIEDDSIREVALNGGDTATRAKVIWQVKVTDKLNASPENIDDEWKKLTTQWQLNRCKLKARSKQASDSTSPCVIAPTSGYQGFENQLYRVEIHQGGTVASGATFKWSRENGAIAFSILERQGNIVTVSSAGSDTLLGLSKGQWVELLDDRHELLGIPGALVQIMNIEGQTVTIDPKKIKDLPNLDPDGHPKLRRWDYRAQDPKNGGAALSEADNAIPIKEGTDEQNWLLLEDGISIQFQPNATYRTGDYWLIPARIATGNIVWETDPVSQQPAALPPHGVEHHYAPLAAFFSADSTDKRKPIRSLTS